MTATPRTVAAAIDKVLQDRLSFLERRALLELAEVVRQNERQNVEGAIVEAGCARGGSALVIASAKDPARPLRLYDVFGMLPRPGLEDGLRAWYLHILNRLGLRRMRDGRLYYGYEKDLLGTLVHTFVAFGLPPNLNAIEFVRGRYQDTLRQPLQYPVSLAHIDCDWYDSVSMCLRAIEPQLSPGGRLVLDDYYVFPGCRRAVEEYLDLRGRDRYVIEGQQARARLHITKKAAPVTPAAEPVEPTKANMGQE